MRSFFSFFKGFLHSSYFYFVIIGSLGFLIDATIFYLFSFQFDIFISRFFSIITAMMFTWLANRLFTFKMDSCITVGEFLKYIVVNGIGALINFGIFIFLCKFSVFLSKYFIIAMIFSTLIAMLNNFIFSKVFVFKKNFI